MESVRFGAAAGGDNGFQRIYPHLIGVVIQGALKCLGRDVDFPLVRLLLLALDNGQVAHKLFLGQSTF